jgi:hypothetical protein
VGEHRPDHPGQERPGRPQARREPEALGQPAPSFAAGLDMPAMLSRAFAPRRRPLDEAATALDLREDEVPQMGRRDELRALQTYGRVVGRSSRPVLTCEEAYVFLLARVAARSDVAVRRHLDARKRADGRPRRPSQAVTLRTPPHVRMSCSPILEPDNPRPR